jgi:polysaccharide chain length determinant protein (PEP-CTERM system associated)
MAAKEDGMAHRELQMSDYVAMFRRRWVLILVLALIGPPLAYALSVVLPPRYKSQTTVLVQAQSVSSELIKPVDTSDLSQRLASMQQQILSRSQLEPLIKKYNLFAKESKVNSMDALVLRLQKDIDVSPILPMAETRAHDLPGFNVTVTLDNAHDAQNVCSDITSLFIERSIQSHIGQAERTADFLAQQVTGAKAYLDDQDAKLAEFKSKHFQELPDDEPTNLNLLSGLNTQLAAATQALEHAQQDKSLNETLLAQQLSSWQAAQTGAVSPDTLDRQLTALQSKLSDLQSRYTDDHPDVIRAKADIAALQKKMNAESAGGAKSQSPHSNVEPPQIQQLRALVKAKDMEIASRTREQDRIQGQIRMYEGRIQSSPGVEEQYKVLSRGYQTALDSYNDLLKRKTEAEQGVNLERKQEGEQLTVLDAANLPDKPSFPNRPLFVLGGLGGGLGLGFGLAFLMEMKDTSFKTERDVEAVLQLPVLAMVPSLEPPSVKGARGRALPKGAEIGARA